MCDYSLHAVSSRPARIDEALVTSGFPGTSTRGFTGVRQPGVAVCLLPGTELAFEKDVEWDRPFQMFRRKPKMGRVVRFRQIEMHDPNVHHDAVEFPNGKIVLLTRLRAGQQARVLQIPSQCPADQERQHLSQPATPSEEAAELPTP